MKEGLESMEKQDVKSDARSASEVVFDHMMDSITQGEWKLGEKIPSENKLSQKYNVSRVTVRAAIQRMVSMGLLESRQGEGTYLTKPSLESRIDNLIPALALSQTDRLNVFEFRRTIETGAAALAAQRADAETIAELFKLSSQMKGCECQEETVELDLAFHRKIAEATGNPMFVMVFDVMKDSYRALFEHNVSMVGSSGASFHYMLANAIEAREPELARVIMLKHINNALTGAEGIKFMTAGVDNEDKNIEGIMKGEQRI